MMIYKGFLIDMTLHRINWKYKTTQTILVIEAYWKISTTKLRQSSMNFYTLWLTHHCPGTAHPVAVCHDTLIILLIHMLVAPTLSYQSLNCQHLIVMHVIGCTSETHLRH